MKKFSLLFRVLAIVLACMLVLASCDMGGANNTEDDEETSTEHVHKFGSWEIVRDATEEKDGVKERYCDCGEVQKKNYSLSSGNNNEHATNDSENDDVDSDNNPTYGGDKVRYDAIPEEGYDGSEVTIVFYHTMGQNLRAVLDKYIEEFNKLYPNITVVHSQVGGYDDLYEKTCLDLAQGNAPNIVYCYPEHVAVYNMTSAVVPLDNFIESKIPVTDAYGNTTVLGFTDEQRNDFIPGYYAEGTAFDEAGTMYSLPMSKSTEVLYYNKTFFEANGISVPATWSEMEEVCKRILEIDPNCIPLGHDSESNLFITMCEQLGTPYISTTDSEHFIFDTAENRDFMKMFSQWYVNGYFTTQQIYGAYTSGLFVAQSGIKSYMNIGSSAGATHHRPTANYPGGYPFEVGIAMIPQADPSNPKVISQGPSLCIFDQENKQEVVASWLFMEFLTTNSNFQAEFSLSSGYMPVIESALEHPVYQNFLSYADGGDYIAALAIKMGLEQSDAYFKIPIFNGTAIANDQVRHLVQDCLIQCSLSGDSSDFDRVVKKAFEDAVSVCKFLYS